MSIKPLAEIMRAKTLSQFAGQTHIAGKGSPVYEFLQKKHIQSMIFWGPPGTGKTTLARIISKELGITWLAISATDSGVKELKDIASKSKAAGRILLFIDEIHRFNKLQQDVLLPHLEKGNLVIIGSTTENPAFSVNKAILSRCIAFQFYPLNETEIFNRLLNVSREYNLNVSEKIIKKISWSSEGDMRKAINMLEAVSVSGVDGFKDFDRNPVYDRHSDEHYNHASALQKSIRGSDPDAAVYWLSKMIAAGEDPEFITRRLMVIAAEDIGNADPQATILASAVLNAVQNLGLPEARIHLSQLTLYLAKAPKSNETILAVDSALSDINSGKSYPVPSHIQDAHYAGAKEIAGVEGYIYSHSNPFDEQIFFPKKLINKKYSKESEIDYLPDQIEAAIITGLKELKSNIIDFHILENITEIPRWKLKKALKYLVKTGKLKINRDYSFKLIKNQ